MSILSTSDSVAYIEADVSNFNYLFEITFDVSNINNLNVDNVFYGFSNNSDVFNNINFSNSIIKYGFSGENNKYNEQSLKRDLQRHLFYDKVGHIFTELYYSNSSFVQQIKTLDEVVEEQIQAVFDALRLENSKMSSEISGNTYEYYFNLAKQLFQLTLQEQDRENTLQYDISLAQQNQPNAQQLTVNLKFKPGDALVLYVYYKINNFNLTDSDKSYRIVILLK